MADRLGFSFRPAFEGAVEVERVPEDFFARVERRVAEGLLVPGHRARARYHSHPLAGGGLVIEAQDFLTAYNVGLNHVELRRTGPGTIAYRVRFDRWHRISMVFGMLFGLVMALATLIPSVQRALLAYRFGLHFFWLNLFFWAWIWPWLLTALHRPFARRALERILREELHGR